MAQEVTLGGDRLGSGKQQKVELHNYGMNSFNLSQDWKSTMAPGVLYPCLRLIGTNHGTFDIDIETFIRTIPTKGPLFGSYKFQVDVFAVPMRLYQGILHNNPTDIGMDMDKVYLPKMILSCVDGRLKPTAIDSNEDNWQVNESALLKYDGISGWGRPADAGVQQETLASRKMQCVPELAYYDIFKCYYSNKQEENAYVITPGNVRETNPMYRLTQGSGENEIVNYEPYNGEEIDISLNNNWSWVWQIYVTIPDFYEDDIIEFINDGNIKIVGPGSYLPINTTIFVITTNKIPNTSNRWQITVIARDSEKQNILDALEGQSGVTTTKAYFLPEGHTGKYTSDIELTPFALKNIDKMRYKLLATNEMGSEFIIQQAENDDPGTWDATSGEDRTGLPYIALVKMTDEGISWNAFTMNGLMVKTYQSDLFNNWLQSEFVDKITRMTKVDTTSGGFTMDTLNLQEKFYNLLNRIIVGGGTYEDWQEAVYGEGAVRKSETPIYIGGMSSEVMFEEVISTAETNVNNDRQALGSLGGRGRENGKRGGSNIHCRVEEPSYIMAICSLTPRICYNQGNEWDRTELDTLDDLHKPELDGIGFQDLMAEQMAWWDTVLTPNSDTVLHRNSAGKQTAWINYQTAIDKSYGDFAKKDGYSFMVLNRNYEHGNGTIGDLTTYIDPAKYNYAFAYDKLDAQNFWVQIHFNIVARRKMGAQQLPNL